MRRLVTLMLLMMVAATTSAQLRFNANKEFKIVQFTDAHVRQDCEEEMRKTVERLRWVIAAELPDVVIFTGDVVTGEPAVKGWRAILAPTAEANVPFVVVLGNHDREEDLSAEELATIICNYPNSLNSATTEGLDDIVLEIMSSDGDRPAALLYCIDSNEYSTIDGINGYGWIEFEQIEWYRSTSRHYTEQNGGKPLPAYAFFHIPLPEYKSAADASAESLVGHREEKECAPEINTGMYAAMKEAGDVVATFVGHDHNNDYIAPYNGIALAYGHFSGDRTVYNSLYSGVRIIKLSEGERDFETWITDYRARHRGTRRDHVRFDAQRSKLKEVE